MKAKKIRRYLLNSSRINKKEKKELFPILNKKNTNELKNINRSSSGIITTQNGKIFNHIEKNMDLYKSELKMIKPKPIIKKFLSKDIKINKDYVLVENLQERQILPEFYDDFEEEDIKSLEKSLERSIDKILY